MTPHVQLLVFYNFLKGREVIHPCPCRSTCFNCISRICSTYKIYNCEPHLSWKAKTASESICLNLALSWAGVSLYSSSPSPQLILPSTWNNYYCSQFYTYIGCLKIVDRLKVYVRKLHGESYEIRVHSPF